MNFRVGRIFELSGLEGILVLSGHFFRSFNRAWHAFTGRCQDNFRAVGAHQQDAFAADAFRHKDDAVITARRAGESQSDAGITAGSFDDFVTRFQLAFLLGYVQHIDADAIFDAVGGVEIFQFGDNLRLAFDSNTI